MLIGRDLVLAAAGTALADADAGRGRLLLLAGEAGIGKTTVARAIVDRAHGAGAEVRWGACWEGDSVLPFAVWADCLRRPGGDACARIAQRLERGELDAGVDVTAPDRERLRFFADVIDALREVARSRLQVVVLEDLHWADALSLQLLRAIAGHLPSMRVLVVGTFRDDEMESDGPLSRIGGGAETIALGGLVEDDVRLLLHEVVGRPPTEEDVRSVFARTGGNPLFVTQVGRLLASGGAAVVPGGAREVLARRLARVSPDCYRVLGAASVLGVEFDVATVAAMLGETDEDVIRALEEAAALRLAAPLEGAPRRWSFAHALVGAARYEALGVAERAGLHRRAVEALRAGGRAPATVLAHHAGRARFDSGDPLPAEIDVAAAREAIGRLAWDEAVPLCERALEVAPAGGAGDGVRAEAWLALGDALRRTGDTEGSAKAFSAAVATARDHGWADVFARAALGFSAGLGSFEVRLFDRRQLDLLEEATAMLPGDAPLRPYVLARLSVALSFVTTDTRRLALADEAIELARELRDGRALAIALAARCDARAGPDHVAERRGAASEIVALARQEHDARLELLGRRHRAVALLELRDLPGFRAEVEAYARTAEQLGDPLYAWYVPLWRAMLAYADGRVDESVAEIEQAGAIGSSVDSLNAGLLTQTVRLFMALDRRDADEVDRRFVVMTSLEAQYAERVVDVVRAYVELVTGRAERGRITFERLGPDALRSLPRDQEWLTGVGAFLVSAVLVGDEPLVREAYELLAPYEGLGAFEGIAAVDHGVVDRYLVFGAAFLGDAGAVHRHVDRALQATADAGRLVATHTRADCARALRMTSDGEAHARGAELARTAARSYDAMGFDALAAEMRGLFEDATATAASPSGSSEARASLVQEGDTWCFTYAGGTARVRHAKGVADLATLLRHPGRDVHVRTLEGVDDVALGGSAQPVLDERALGEYRRRLREIETGLDEADRSGDAARAEALAAERDALVEELTRGAGPGGRRRRFDDADERLRKAVSARVKASIDRIEALHPALGRHLRNSVHTGYSCSYRPEQAVSWEVVEDRSS